MAITYTDDLARFDDVVSVEEAEGLLQWLQEHPHGRADLSACTHLHAADLQVLMAGAVAVLAWPRDAILRSWLCCALAPTPTVES
ncbi:hypothetical protein [Massilia sp. PWRC2]|uniref:hypothetical protein n=1 Tax=Massilia sp. PWRC2 TaxID=2804626 RepID=UPI003CF74F64